MKATFLDYCKYARNLCESTCVSYGRTLDIFNEWTEARRIRLEDVTQDDILTFMRDKHKAGVKPASINQYVVAIRAFYDWAVRFYNERFTKNPAVGIDRMKVPHRAPVCIPAWKMTAILEAMPEQSFKELRSKVVVLLGYHCGLRRAEICSLSDTDVDFHTGTIRVYGKGRKTRLVPLSVQLSAMLQKYIAARQVLFPYGVNQLLVTHAGEPLSYSQLAEVVYNALRAFLPASLCHCHILRHSFATACMNAGVSLENIASVMGHASVQTTMIYLTISADRIKQQLANVF